MKNKSLNAKITCLELENKSLYDRIALSNEKPNTSNEHIESHVDDFEKENEILKKKNIKLNDVILNLQMGKRYWITCLIHKNMCSTNEALIINQI